MSVIKNTLFTVVVLTAGVFAGVYGKGILAKYMPAATTMYQSKGSGTVAATVDGYNIYKDEVIDLVKRLGATKDADVQKIYPVALSQIVSDRLVEAEVAKSGLKNTEDFKVKLAETEKQLAKSIYFEQALAGKVTEEDAQKEYDAIKSKNDGIKEARARHILVKTDTEAKQVIKDLEKGRKFEELAAERSIDATAQRGGDLGYFAQEGELVPEFSKAAFALKKGEYTKEPVKTQLGFHVIKLEDVRNRKVPAYKDMKANIQNNIAQKLVMEEVKALRAKAKVEMFDFNGNPIPEVANAPAPMGMN